MSSIEGMVIEGKKISKNIGFPTLNLELDKTCPFNYGVYAGIMEHNGKVYYGAINIGVTPYFGINKPKLEIHVFDFNQNLYGQKIKVTPLHFIREEMTFNNIDELTQQISNDCDLAKKLLDI